MSICKLSRQVAKSKKIESIKKCCYSSTPTVTKIDTDKPDTFVDDIAENANLTSYKTFDKSGLLRQHRNILHENIPYEEPQSWIHLTEKYQRKLFGRYGSQSGVNERICFSTRNNEYDKLGHPSLEEMIANVRKQTLEKRENIRKREDDVAKKLDKLELWKSELNAKIAKKEADTLAAKERKEKLIEEVRRYFGFKVDPRDERFKEMLEKKEREDKKKQKEAKRKAKEEKMAEKIVLKSNNKSSE